MLTYQEAWQYKKKLGDLKNSIESLHEEAVQEGKEPETDILSDVEKEVLRDQARDVARAMLDLMADTK